MSDHHHSTLTGEVTDIFAHRFVVLTKTRKILADLGPKGAEQVALRLGDKVTMSGEMKASELKVHKIQKEGGPTIGLDHKKPRRRHHEEHDDADPKLALETVRRQGFSVAAGPRHKPRHFEILGKDSRGDLVELHLEFGGALRHARAATKDDPKWADEMRDNS
jgi:hypothetical protein